MSKETERAHEYRVQAAELLKRSERQVDPQQRTLMLDMAITYQRMAEQLEEMRRLDVAPLGPSGSTSQ